MTTLTIGGVPEHFNLPWQMAIEQNIFANSGIQVHWSYYPGGTGEMVGKLNDGELDMAILLTEGFISAYAKGLNAVIVKDYITSPLVWGIFTGAGSGIDSVYAAKAKRIAISRKGSGSHLMALIHAEQRGDSISDYELVEIKSLAGAVASLKNNETDLFYWEKYTTKPHVLSGELTMIGEFSAPWSGFLIVANKNAFAQKQDAIRSVLDIMGKACRDFKSNVIDSCAELQKRFAMSEADSRDWLKHTVWDPGYTIKRKSLQNAANALQRIDDSFRIDAFETMIAEHVILK